MRKELEAQYRKLAEARDRRDVAATLALKTADFHAIVPDGRARDCKTMEQHTRQCLEGYQPPYKIRVTIQNLVLSDSVLIAVAEVRQEVSRYRDLAGRRRKVDTGVVQRETWSKTADGWWLKCVDSLRDQRRYVDGKRVGPTKPCDPDAPPFEPE